MYRSNKLLIHILIFIQQSGKFLLLCHLKIKLTHFLPFSQYPFPNSHFSLDYCQGLPGAYKLNHEKSCKYYSLIFFFIVWIRYRIKIATLHQIWYSIKKEHCPSLNFSSLLRKKKTHIYLFVYIISTHI